MKALRIYFSVYTRSSKPDHLGDWKWSREKQHYDYAPDTDTTQAAADIIKQWGERPEKQGKDWTPPPTFAEIHSHQLIPDIPHAEFKGWRAIEQPLFDGATLKACLKDSPRLASKK